MSKKVLWSVVGVISIIGGFFALANPLAATLTAELLAGWTFMAVGVLQILAAFQQDDWSGRIWAALVGAAGLFVGISLLANPLAGIISLTLLVAILFLVGGIARIIVAMSMRGTKYFWPVLLSGGITLLLAIMIFSGFPQSAATILGILLGVELIFNGFSLIAIGQLFSGAGENREPVQRA